MKGKEENDQQLQLSESISSLSLDDCTESQCEGSRPTSQRSATIVHTPGSMETSSPVLPVMDHHPQSGAAAIDIGQQSTVQYLQREMRVSQVSSFSRTDAFIQEAIDAYQKAIRLSEQQNVPALYDLALLYRSLGEFDEALGLLNFIQVSRKTTMRPCDRINAYELAGLILKEKSELEEDEEQKRRLNEEGESKLNMALRLCSRLCSRLPRLQPYVRHVWKSFATLFEAAEKSERKTTDKLFEKARLFRLIRDNRQSMALLQEMESITPSKANDPQYFKMWVENYVDLGQYDKALTFLETLTLTARGSAMDLFEDDQYVQKVYIQAGRTELLKATTAEDVHRASSYFSEAFSDALDKLRSSSEAQTSSSEDTADESSDKGDGPGWDVMILHEDSATEKAEEVAKVLREACGLRVTRMEEDCPPGRFVLDSLCWTMNRCRQVVIAAGARRVSPKLRLLLERAVKRASTVSLLVEGTHVPKVAQAMTLAPRRCARDLCCPQVLLEGRGEEEGEDGGGEGGGGVLYSEVQVQAVCDVFCFLTDVSI